MTTRRLIASISVSASALAVAAVLVVRAFPLQAQTTIANEKGMAYTIADKLSSVQIVRGGENLLHGEVPEYPRRAIEQRVGGNVVLDLTVDDRGEVSDARVVSGPEELRRVALEAVLQWHYSAAAIHSTTTQVEMQFTVPSVDIQAREGWRVEPDGVEALTVVKRQVEELQSAFNDPNTSDQRKDELKKMMAERRAQLLEVAANQQGGRLSQIRSERVTDEVRQEILARAGLKIGDAVNADDMKKFSEIARSIDEHIHVRFESDRRGNVILMMVAP